LNVDRTYKWLKKIVFWFKSSLTSTTTLGVTLDDNSAFTTGGTFILNSGVYNPNYFDSAYFLVTTGSDYRIVNINNPCRWAQFTLTCTSGIVSFLGWSMVGQAISNKEG